MSADENHYDIIILGGGSAGYAAARTALEYTQKVAVVDGASELGGLCILRGCMPSKTLLYSAEIAHVANHGEKLGLETSGVRVNPAKLQERKRRLIGEFADYRAGQLQDGRFDLFRSKAKFLDHLTISLDDGKELWADKYVIATGSVIHEPSITGLNEIESLTSDEILSLSELPESIVVLGGGIVACELAQYLNRSGVRVTMVQRNPFLLKETSPEASRTVRKALEDEGIRIFTETSLSGVRESGSQVVVSFQDANGPHLVVADKLFNALGRKPATESLDLDQADVQLTASGHIQTNEFQQSTNPAIYAAGDCAGPHEIVHVAIMQGEIAAHHALGGKQRVIDYDHVLKIVFTDPQVALVGLSRAEIVARGIDFCEASYPFFDHGKSLVMDANYGYVRVFARKQDGRVIGAECVGKDASECIHSLSVAVANNLSISDLLKVHWYHPTLSEIWTYPLEDIQEEIAG